MDYVAATSDILQTKGVREEIRKSDTQTEKCIQSFDFAKAIFKYIFVPKLLDFVHLHIYNDIYI